MLPEPDPTQDQVVAVDGARFDVWSASAPIDEDTIGLVIRKITFRIIIPDNFLYKYLKPAGSVTVALNLQLTWNNSYPGMDPESLINKMMIDYAKCTVSVLTWRLLGAPRSVWSVSLLCSYTVAYKSLVDLISGYLEMWVDQRSPSWKKDQPTDLSFTLSARVFQYQAVANLSLTSGEAVQAPIVHSLISSSSSVKLDISPGDSTPPQLLLVDEANAIDQLDDWDQVSLPESINSRCSSLNSSALAEGLLKSPTCPTD